MGRKGCAYRSNAHGFKNLFEVSQTETYVADESSSTRGIWQEYYKPVRRGRENYIQHTGKGTPHLAIREV
jgi:hypothetical protein